MARIPGAALDDPHTRRAITRYTTGAYGATMTGLLLGVGVAFLLVHVATRLTPADDRLVALGIVAPLAALAFGLSGVFNLRRVRRAMAQHRWTQVDVRAVPSSSNGIPRLHLTSAGTTWDLYPSTAKWKWGRFVDTTVMFAGDVGVPGALATPDGTLVVWGARPTKLWGPGRDPDQPAETGS